jgi:pimeloyl-ACP methyl ester carboxylesterase
MPKTRTETDSLGTAEVPAALPDVGTELREGYAEVGDQKLHYVEAGAGPLIVLLHGFPEFWFGWRRQIAPLAAAGFRVVAPDTRGYNLSSKPEGFEAYGVDLLAADIRGLILQLGAKSALLVGHDWGGSIACGQVVRSNKHAVIKARLLSLTPASTMLPIIVTGAALAYSIAGSGNVASHPGLHDLAWSPTVDRRREARAADLNFCDALGMVRPRKA